MEKVGLALGGGGARGMAHVLALETIDACGVAPVVLSGTSMGSIIGALYASGLSGTEIRERVAKHMITEEDTFKDVLAKRADLLKWLGAVRLEFGKGGFLRADGFLGFLLEEIRATTFEELAIPLHVVATDFWSGKPVVFSSGELLPAIKASMAIPGVFSPVAFDGKVLVDGGVVNNLPYDIIADQCDYTIAVDVAPTRRPGSSQIPNMIDSVLGMFDILVEAAIESRMERAPPTVYVRPELVDVRTLDFDKIESVYEQSRPAMAMLKSELEKLLQ